MKIIDLTQKLYDYSPVMQGDDQFRLFQNRFLATDNYNGYRLETGLHVGTHIDCASHLTTDPIQICDIPLDKFIGNGVLIDARGKKNITADDIGDTIINKGDIVLVLTGTDKYFGEQRYFTDIPLMEESFAEVMIQRRVKMVGIDYFSPDKYPYNVHKMLFAEGILIMENLTNLEALVNIGEFTITALPLKLAAEASLVRAAAVVK
jgi:Predicted metal-dependent hydrolase